MFETKISKGRRAKLGIAPARPTIVLLSSILVLSCFTSKADSYKEPRYKQLGKAYGYHVGQASTLQRIADEFPDLKPQIVLAEATFAASPYGDSLRGIQSEFKELLNKRFPATDSDDFFSKLEEEVKAPLSQQTISHTQAQAFVNEVLNRAKGEIQPDVRRILLSASPRLNKYPAKGITEGLSTRFSSKGHPKSKGREFSISIPYSWRSREGSRPNIIQTFHNKAGHGPLQCILSVHPIPNQISSSEFLELILDEDPSGFLQDGASLIRSDRVTVDGLPGAEIVSNLKVERVGIKLSTRTVQYVVVDDSHYFLINFLLAEQDGPDSALDGLESKYLRLIKAMASSFVILDQY